MINRTTGLIELDHQRVSNHPDDYLDGLANQWLTVLLALEPEDFLGIKLHQDALSELGVAEQKAVWALNERMQTPLQKIMAESQGGGEVNTLLQLLQTKIVKIKPPRNAFLARLKNMFMLLFSWQQSAWHMWLESYPFYKQEVTKIIAELAQYQQQFKRDNKILLAIKNDLEVHSEQLENFFYLGGFLMAKINAKTCHESELVDSKSSLIKNEFLRPLQQRTLALQQQLLIARQSLMTMELFIAQNQSQIKSIEQTINTTSSVIDVTAQIMMLEQGQKNLQGITTKTNAMNHSIDTKTLRQARQAIDHALAKIHVAQHQSKQSSEELVVKANLSSQG